MNKFENKAQNKNENESEIHKGLNKRYSRAKREITLCYCVSELIDPVKMALH